MGKTLNMHKAAAPASPVNKSQTDRILARVRVLRDIDISEGARMLYMLLDDEARGQTSVAIKQLRLAVLCGVTKREIRYRLAELLKAGYLRVVHQRYLNLYCLERNTCSTLEGSGRNACSTLEGSERNGCSTLDSAIPLGTRARSGNSINTQEYCGPSPTKTKTPEPPEVQTMTENEDPCIDDIERQLADESWGWQPPEDQCYSCHGTGFRGAASDRSKCGICRGTGKKPGFAQEASAASAR